MAKRRYEMTEAKIARLLREGRGSGEEASYKPFLNVWSVPSLGRRARILGRKTGRVHHLLSDLELAAFLEADWQEDVSDIREQYPLDRDVTRRIARGMGVRHPSTKGIDIVMTTDLVVTRSSGICPYSVKYMGDLASHRVREKLEIERRYWGLQGAALRVVTERHLPKQRSETLAWLHGCHDAARHPWPRRGYWQERAADLVGRLSAVDPALEIARLIGRLEKSGVYEPGEVLSILRWMASVRLIAFDIDRRFDVRWPVSELTLPTAGSA